MSALVEHLLELQRRQDRAAFAVLRRAAASEPGRSADAFPLVLPWVPENARQRRDEWAYFLVATLFALHPAHAEAGNFGRTMWRTATEGSEKPNPSADLRFRRLLEADRDDLPGLLRSAVRLAASRAAPPPVNYDLLLTHLLAWNHPDAWVQREWARTYWTPTEPALSIHGD